MAVSARRASIGVRKWFKKAITRRRRVAKTSQEKRRPWPIVVALETGLLRARRKYGPWSLGFKAKRE
jgi:hypothetical protein